MNERKRGIYVTLHQKRKLIELLTQNAEALKESGKSKSSVTLWRDVATECNNIPGARKSWRQWKKTWQDLKAKTRKRYMDEQKLPSYVYMLSAAERGILGVGDIDPTAPKPITTFEGIRPEMSEESYNDNFLDTANNAGSTSEAESYVQEQKVFAVAKPIRSSSRLKSKSNSVKHSNNCDLNCDLLLDQEQRKIKIKESYFEFKKDYLSQKLALMKKQVEALQSIANSLNNK